jgi:hypothetical protein
MFPETFFFLRNTKEYINLSYILFKIAPLVKLYISVSDFRVVVNILRRYFVKAFSALLSHS